MCSKSDCRTRETCFRNRRAASLRLACSFLLSVLYKTIILAHIIPTRSWATRRVIALYSYGYRHRAKPGRVRAARLRR